jgi:hypothetical protein
MRILSASAVFLMAACVGMSPVGLKASQHGPAVHGQSHAKPPHPATPSQGAGKHAPRTSSQKPTTPKGASIGQSIAAKPELAARLQPMLPAGMSFETAAAGFRNQGQFVAALHVSQNIGISFVQMRSLMVDQHESLGQAIHALRPGADATAEADRAEKDAQKDLDSVRGRE